MLMLDAEQCCLHLIKVVNDGWHNKDRTLFATYTYCIQYYGNPANCLTLTTNPEWLEIVENLLLGETAIDRPMLTNKVFELKHKHLTKCRYTIVIISQLKFQQKALLITWIFKTNRFT